MQMDVIREKSHYLSSYYLPGLAGTLPHNVNAVLYSDDIWLRSSLTQHEQDKKPKQHLQRGCCFSLKTCNCPRRGFGTSASRSFQTTQRFGPLIAVCCKVLYTVSKLASQVCDLLMKIYHPSIQHGHQFISALCQLKPQLRPFEQSLLEQHKTLTLQTSPLQVEIFSKAMITMLGSVRNKQKSSQGAAFFLETWTWPFLVLETVNWISSGSSFFLVSNRTKETFCKIYQVCWRKAKYYSFVPLLAVIRVPHWALRITLSYRVWRGKFRHSP